MTDRIRTVTVILDRDYRDDDSESALNALRMVKGVTAVETQVLTGPDYAARRTAVWMLREKTINALLAVFDAVDTD